MNLCFDGLTKTEKLIAAKVFSGQRIHADEAVYLYEKSDLAFCAYLADYIKRKKFGNNVFYNKNIHVEISNICSKQCTFCSFYREKDDPDAWSLGVAEIMSLLEGKKAETLTEVHVVGALNPDKDLDFYIYLFSSIKKKYPNIHIKALTAVELEYLCNLSAQLPKTVLSVLKEAGMDSMAGGGAEILDDDIRAKICPEKTSSKAWLDLHKQAHFLGLSSNCTMLYGHIESYKDRVGHMEKLRNLQDETQGFNCFIPLKYKHYANNLNISKEVPLVEDLKNYSISRIFMDNIEHLKTYWPMCGKKTAFLSLHYGVDDLDGTISDTTKIYSMAGSEEQNPVLSTDELISRSRGDGLIAIERDSLYKII